MAGYVVERHGYVNAGSMAADIITDMIANGFVQIKPSGGSDFNKSTATGAYFICLEAGPTVDPLNSTQPWRVGFDIIMGTGTGATVPEVFMAYVGTPLQITASGALAERSVDNSGDVTFPDIIGAVGGQVNPNPSSYNCVTVNTANGVASYKPLLGNTNNVDEPGKGLVNRIKRVGTSGSSYPLSYRLVIGPRGFWLGVWEDASTTETSSAFNWVLVQRPVDRTTGAVLTTGKAPVFCVNASGGRFWQFTVRESDILRPGKRRFADTHSEDSEAIINAQNQVSLSEDGKYIVTFPSRLNTSRYRYPHELDMLGITSADVVSQNSDVPLTVYGESAARTYKAMHGTGGSNTGMRLLVLSQGGGIS